MTSKNSFDYREDTPQHIKDQIDQVFKTFLDTQRPGVGFNLVLSSVLSSNGISNELGELEFITSDDETSTNKTKHKREKKKEIRCLLENTIDSYGFQCVYSPFHGYIIYNDYGLIGRTVVTYATGVLTVIVTLPECILDDFLHIVEDNFQDYPVHILEECIITGKGTLDTRSVRKTYSSNYVVNNVFYPYFDYDISTWFSNFLKAPSNVSVLVGPPGTGKSNYIMSCIDSLGPTRNRVYLVSSEDVITSESFTSFLKDLDDGDIMIIEDADRLLGKREEGNEQMAGLLNAVSGILNKDIKFIITTNRTNLKMVDEALLRPGRTYDILEFKRLTADQANNARQAIGKTPVDFDAAKDFTLAQALNWDEGNASKLKSNSIGFVK